MSTRPFRLVVVAEDRKILRRLTRFLSVFGFVVEAIADCRQALSSCQANPPDFLIVDSDSLEMESCRQLFAKHRAHYTHTLLLIRDAEMEGLTEALMAGVDDFLAKPLVYGELLARLRSGARVLEYERRMREQSAMDHATRLLSQSAFRDRLRSELTNPKKSELSCVLIDLDFFDHVHRLHGFGAGREVLNAVVSQIKSMAGECKYLASLGSGRFAAMLPDSSDAQALAWAEKVRVAIAELQIPVRDTVVQMTASFGVAGTMQGTTSADELLRRAAEAIRMAKSSGRNCVARCGQFDGETREWEDLARQGRLFENTVARDVMVPCPLFVHEEESVLAAAELLTRSRLSEIPVVDRHGQLLGLFSAEKVPAADATDSRWKERVSTFMVTQFKTVPEDESFGSLMEFFMADAEANHVAVVVRHDKPLGIVYRSGLAALSEPLSVTSFAPDTPYSPSSDYLVIPDGRSTA